MLVEHTLRHGDFGGHRQWPVLSARGEQGESSSLYGIRLLTYLNHIAIP
jgi:hypothetical protein